MTNPTTSTSSINAGTNYFGTKCASGTESADSTSRNTNCYTSSTGAAGGKTANARFSIKLSRGFSTFMNWFDGICAPLCGIWMMASALVALPFSWNDWMPLSIYDAFPFHDVFFTSHFWPGLALLLVNGLPNIIAIAKKHRSGDAAWVRWCIVAGALLVVWTTTELFIIPNGLSIFYFVLGVLQAATAVYLERNNRAARL